MYGDDLIPHLLVHIDKGLVPQDPRVCNQNMNGSERVDGALDDGLALLRGADHRNRITTGCGLFRIDGAKH